MESQYNRDFSLTPVTTGLLTVAIFLGGAIAGLLYARVTDAIGRRPAMLWAALLTVGAVALQAGAWNQASFVAARVLVGFGTSASGLAGPAYLAETLPVRWRAWGLGAFNDFYYVVGPLPPPPPLWPA
jgi:MFS family permease